MNPNQTERPAIGVQPSWGRFLGWFFAFAALAGLISVVVHLGEVEHFGELVQQARPVWLLAGLGFQAATYFCAAWVWHRTLPQLDEHLPFRSLVPLSVAKLFADQAMPSGGISGALLTVAGLRHRGVSEPHALAVLLVSLVSFYAAYLVATVAAILLLWLRHEVSPILSVLAAIFSLVAVGVPVAVIWGRRRLMRPLPSLLEHRPSIELLRRVSGSTEDNLLGNRRLLLTTTAMQTTVFALDAATLWAMLQATGHPQDFTVALVAFVMASVTGTLSPLPLGIGAFESGCVALLTHLGTDIEPALAATLLLRGFTLWLPMLPGLWLMRRETHTSTWPTRTARQRTNRQSPL